jgi:hypothetical protein
MNYSELTAAIQSYTENQFPDTYLANGSVVSSLEQINTFIEQAEQRIYNSVQFPVLRKNIQGSLTANNQYLACPADFLAPYSIAVILADGSYVYLLNKDVNLIRQAYPKPTSVGVPQYYALFGAQSFALTDLAFLLGPTPDANYGVEMHYFYYPQSITLVGSSWLGDNFDSVLLYGSLVEAYTYMKGEADMVTLYNTKYNEALALAKRLGDGMERQDAYRNGQVRIKVT